MEEIIFLKQKTEELILELEFLFLVLKRKTVKINELDSLACLNAAEKDKALSLALSSLYNNHKLNIIITQKSLILGH